MIVFYERETYWERDLFSSKNCLFSSKEEIKTRTFIVIKNITPSSYRAFDWKEQILVLAPRSKTAVRQKQGLQSPRGSVQKILTFDCIEHR